MAHASEKYILVVDDEPDVRNFLATYIEDAGFQVETAVDGIDAIEKVEASIPDLITLDMVMPRGSGIEVMRTLRDNEKWKKIPVIIITAHAHDELGSNDIKIFSGFTSGLRPRYIFEKPVTPEKLVQSIGEILDVEIDIITQDTHVPQSSENNKMQRMLKGADEKTLEKIKDLLKASKQ